MSGLDDVLKLRVEDDEDLLERKQQIKNLMLELIGDLNGGDWRKEAF